MKPIVKIIIFVGFFSFQFHSAQFLDKLAKKAEKAAERAVERKVEEKASKKTEEAMDEVLQNKKEGKKDKKKENDKNPTTGGGLEEEDGLSEDGPNEVNFARGSKILFQDNFDKDAVGDFPARWNSSGSGEVKKLKGFSEKWLKIPAKSVINLELTKALPENFTLEFDLILPSDAPDRMAGFGIGEKPQTMDHLLAAKNSFNVYFKSNNKGHDQGLKFGRDLGNEYTYKKVDYSAKLDKTIKIAIEINGKRYRLFVDGVKKVDMPTVMDAKIKKSIFFSAITHGGGDSLLNYFYISNVVLAETGKDERSQILKDLLEKGNFSTNAILFASGSDKIQASSDAILNQIADALNQASELKIAIIGHTDSDGDDNKNLVLSQKRANAVKIWLASKGINASRLTTNGKGESEPVAENGSEGGKSQNRRVVFEVIK